MVWNNTINADIVPIVTKALSRIRVVTGGYLGGENNIDLMNTSGITYIGASIWKAQGILYLAFEKAAGWGVTNNTPIAGEMTISYTVST